MIESSNGYSNYRKYGTQGQCLFSFVSSITNVMPLATSTMLNYLAYLEECGVQMARAHSLPIARMMEAGFGNIVE